MLLSTLLSIGLLCGADPAPKPKLITSGGVVKVDPAADPVWNEVTADPILTVLESPAKSRWVPVDAGCKVVPAGDGKTATFAAPKSGRYRLVVLPEAGDPVLVAVLVGKVDPVIPPKPDDPVIPPPTPVSDLGKKLQAAYDMDPGTAEAKAKMLADKVELYKQAAALASDHAVTSLGGLVAAVKQAADTLHTERLPAVRKAVRAELAAAFPTDATMTDDVRERARAVFAKIQSALKEVK